MPKYNIDNYELVEDRLKKFWKDNPNARINTDVVGNSDDGTMVIVKAELFINKEDTLPIATGLAQETKGIGGFANNEAWLENCESSAIGRALANWKYQGSKKPRPTQEEMKKVIANDDVGTEKAPEQPKKKQVTQENGKSHSEISEVELKKLVFEMCDKDKKFAEACWKNSHSRTKLKDKTLTDNVGEWEKYTVEMFLEFADNYVKKFKKDFEIRAGNSDSINEVLETFDAKIVEEKENEVADIPEGKWINDSISEAQIGFIESLIAKAIDSGQDELGAEAKSYLNSGEATKGNASEWIEKLQKATE
tara:strand:- start:1329 stop:2249 length:921 start_codon:yes stop_codon:yes gene_type:complete